MSSPSGSATILVEAPARRVYDLAADIERMGEWSPETFRASWRSDVDGPALGARFRGWNRRGWLVWPTDPVVEAAEPGRLLSFVTTFFGVGRFTRWSYRFTARTDEQTEVEESWEQVGAVPIFSRMFVSSKREDQLQAGMEETLRRLKAAAER